MNELAFAPDGKSFASASWDYTARLWDLDTRTYRKLRGYTTRVNAVAFSPDGATLATASNDKTVRLWSVVPRRKIDSKTMSTHSQPTAFLRLDPDALQIPIDEVTAKLAAISQNGKLFATPMAGCRDTIVLWDLNSLEDEITRGAAHLILFQWRRTGGCKWKSGRTRRLGSQYTTANPHLTGRTHECHQGGRLLARRSSPRIMRLGRVIGDLRSCYRPAARHRSRT